MVNSSSLFALPNLRECDNTDFQSRNSYEANSASFADKTEDKYCKKQYRR